MTRIKTRVMTDLKLSARLIIFDLEKSCASIFRFLSFVNYINQLDANQAFLSLSA